MVPEGLLEGAALSASEPVDEGNLEAEAEAAVSTEVAAEGSTGFNCGQTPLKPRPSCLLILRWEGLL